MEPVIIWGMPLLTITGLAKSFGPNDIFSGVTASISHRARIALVGPNGVGKTTLLRILLGLEEPSAGDVQRSRGLQIDYLPQEAGLDSDSTLWEEGLHAVGDLLEMQAELTRLEGLMGQPDQAEATLEAYGRLQARFEHRGGYTYETRIKQTLTGLGFLPQDFQRPVSQLSGGQRTRALLARLLLSDPDLLLLDEPTNHLDIAAVEWLENYLHDWDGAVLVVSHDRYFMDQVAQTVWEMTPAFELYHGNYSAYLAQRSERYARQLEEYQAQTEFIEKEEEYIRRNIAGQNTRQAQGRRKRLERLLEDSRLTPPIQQRRLRLDLQTTQRSGDLVLRTENLSVGYADEGRPLFRVPDLILRRGECAALIGPNGAGKTTFLKTILNQIPPYEGEATLGASLQIGYFAQAHEGLHPELDLVEEIQTVAPRMLPGETREYLAKFLFRGDDVFKKVEVLSGGERGRLALAKLALSGANLLLLDEPTNHLDLPAQEVLQSILADFRGTILLVSHDRFLIDAMATQIWDVDPQVATLRVFEGSYSEYKAAQASEAAPLGRTPGTSPLGKTPGTSPLGRTPGTSQAAPAGSAADGGKAAKSAPRERRRGPASNNAERRRLAQIQELEERIAALERQLAAISKQLENPPEDPGKVQHLGSEYVRIERQMDEMLNQWDEMMR